VRDAASPVLRTITSGSPLPAARSEKASAWYPLFWPTAYFVPTNFARFSSKVSGIPLKNNISLTEPTGPPSEDAPLSETIIEERR
jgi:hypothetical protein